MNLSLNVRILYNLVNFLALPFFLYQLYWPRNNKPGFGGRWPEHFGISKAVKQVDIWLHAVSVGEVIAVTPLVKQLKQQHPELNILLTTTTATGYQQAEQRLSEEVTHRYAPLDLWPCISLFLLKHQPKQLWIMETELWPNWLGRCASKAIPVKLINARMSERSARRYLKLRSATRPLFSKLDLVLAQHQDDAERFRQLGVEPARLQVTGSVKYDLPDQSQLMEPAKQFRAAFEGRPCWIAASTHKGEDEQVLAMHRQLVADYPELLLILVPRHPERFNSVAELIEQQGWQTARRSHQQIIDEKVQVYLADTMGELMLMYAAADIAFIGGSLVPVGGHNYLEAAAMDLPMVAGSHDFNFSDISQQLQACGALYLSADIDALAKQLARWLDDPQLRKQQGEQGAEIVELNRGALARSLQSLLE
ncbi:lipid IV(A) 3-deoxy-D-manno-octulosonic acid transferase [Aliagarivorans marinus]|uniref:lipid IV(A) 3-deoxy-D-manno-octulosonic acid transferase n=1 Tax=Aliagarivorans marinus TaxID=561965 RepID=UPI000404A4D9|nr:lipid IV(A) 3-deoxy-D-manno-octulosonic acid transferase [Aliagarivorans marinus]